MHGIAKTIALVVILAAPASFWLTAECEAQKNAAPIGYDYYSLALTSISNSAAEASKLPNIPQRVKLLLQAVKLLPHAQHDEAVRLIELALRDVNEWRDSPDKMSGYRPHAAATLRNEVLSVYATLDPEKVLALRQEFQAVAESTTTNTRAASPKNNDWFTQFSTRRTIADQPAKIALSLIDTDHVTATGLVVQSLQGGTVSNVLYDIVQRLIQNGDRVFLNTLEIRMGQVLAANVTLDPFGLANASVLVLADKDMPTAARSAFVSFLMRSLKAWAILVQEPGIDTFYINSGFTLVSLNTRPVFLQYAPEQLVMFELVLDQVAPLVPANTRARLQAFQPEIFSDPRDRLSDILRDSAPERRDLRLVRLVSELLHAESGELQKNLDLTKDAINAFSAPDAKSAYSDLLTITRIDACLKQKKFIEAQEFAGSISSEETRAWAFLSLSSEVVKTDQILGFELISNALKALDKASPSPNKVQLALMASAMLVKKDPQRAFETLSAMAKYANSSSSTVDPPTKPAFAFGLAATIGEAHTELGVFPESLSELKIDPSFAVLGTTDWFRADHIANDIREPSLRLQLKLQFAGAVLAQESKPRRKEPAPKKSARN